jgi:hypothetical protein
MAIRKTSMTRTVRSTKASRARGKRLQRTAQKRNAALVKSLETADARIAKALAPAAAKAKALTDSRALFEKRTGVALSANSPSDVIERLDDGISELVADALDELNELNRQLEAL